jgi:DNA replication protein DnaC
VDAESTFRRYLDYRQTNTAEAWRLEHEHKWLGEEYRRRVRAGERLAALVQAMGERFSPDCVSLDNYVITHPTQRVVLERVKALAARLPDAVKRGESIVLYGSVGTGKDHLLASLLHIAARKHHLDAVWMNGLDYFAACRDRMKIGGETKFTSELAGVDILAFSDPSPPSAAPTDWAFNQLHSVIDSRYNHRRPTWVTVNAQDENELSDVLSVALYDRLRHRGHLIQCLWPSYRERDS